MSIMKSSTLSSLLGLTLLLAGAGCAHQEPRPGAGLAHHPTPIPKATVVFTAAPAKIVSVNAEHNFVVIDFCSRSMPPIGTRLKVYRAGKRAGAVQLTEPVRARFATADVLAGEIHIDDEVP
jgi:hypothetical protein